jgi:hypothetical protein
VPGLLLGVVSWPLLFPERGDELDDVDEDDEGVEDCGDVDEDDCVCANTRLVALNAVAVISKLNLFITYLRL